MKEYVKCRICGKEHYYFLVTMMIDGATVNVKLFKCTAVDTVYCEMPDGYVKEMVFLDRAEKKIHCKRCGAEIVWIRTENGRLMPCEPRRMIVVTDDGKTVSGRQPHWGFCKR